jgi:CelD/BcsL family acetyltransferase involved in cellulose biosynthesis
LWTPELARHRWSLVKGSGVLTLVRREGRIAAGTLSFAYRGESYLVVIAHEPAYDRWNLGNMCLWFSVNYFITAGFAQYHLLWGDSQYKEQFGAVKQQFYRATLFKNRSAQQMWKVGAFFRVARAKEIAKLLWQRACSQAGAFRREHMLRRGSE